MAGDVINQPTLTLEGAKRVAAAAISYARSHGAPGGTIAIVDAGGHTLYLERLDGTFTASSDVSIGKARTAVNFGKPTRGLEESINKGRPALLPVAAPCGKRRWRDDRPVRIVEVSRAGPRRDVVCRDRHAGRLPAVVGGPEGHFRNPCVAVAPARAHQRRAGVGGEVDEVAVGPTGEGRLGGNEQQCGRSCD
jgi:hypothetical protein